MYEGCSLFFRGNSVANLPLRTQIVCNPSIFPMAISFLVRSPTTKLCFRLRDLYREMILLRSALLFFCENITCEKYCSIHNCRMRRFLDCRAWLKRQSINPRRSSVRNMNFARGTSCSVSGSYSVLLKSNTMIFFIYALFMLLLIFQNKTSLPFSESWFGDCLSPVE